MSDPTKELIHAEGAGGDRMLCGVADDVGFTPRVAEPGEVVTCADCKAIIAYCQDAFTYSYRARRK
ncbi:MAG: hypothetical protein ACT4O5_08710 [Gammaproteobacteria bacterium]